MQIERAAIDEVVTADKGRHVLEELENTHRSIKANSEEQLHSIAGRVVANCELWDYSRQDLVRLCRELLDSGRIKKDYVGKVREVFRDELALMSDP